MGALIWLLIPLMATCIAGLWSSWATRRRHNGGGDAAGVAGYAAFRTAMERSDRSRPAAADPAAAPPARTDHHRPAADRAPGSRPAAEPVAEGRPAEDRSGAGRPAEGRPAEGRPAGGRTADDRPAAGRTAAGWRGSRRRTPFLRAPKSVRVAADERRISQPPEHVSRRVPTGVSSDSPSRAAD